MIKINSLKSLENVSDIYYIKDNLEIINITNGYIKKLWKNHDGYPMVTLELKDKSSKKSSINIPMHKIVALAFIDNRESYELIEHLNDIKDDFSVNNLMFSNKSENGKRAFLNGHPNRIDSIFKVTLANNSVYTGTMKELSVVLNMSKATIYDNYYFNRNSRKLKEVVLLK